MVNNNLIVIPASLSSDSVSADGYVSMTLLEDRVVEGTESVELLIESMDSERIIVQNPNPTVVTIRDNDSKSLQIWNRESTQTASHANFKGCVYKR